MSRAPARGCPERGRPCRCRSARPHARGQAPTRARRRAWRGPDARRRAPRARGRSRIGFRRYARPRPRRAAHTPRSDPGITTERARVPAAPRAARRPRRRLPRQRARRGCRSGESPSVQIVDTERPSGQPLTQSDTRAPADALPPLLEWIEAFLGESVSPGRAGFLMRAFCVVAASLLLAGLFSTTTLYPRLAWWLEDLQQRVFARQLPLDHVIVIDVDETSMQRLEPKLGPWPYRRDVYA